MRLPERKWSRPGCNCSNAEPKGTKCLLFEVGIDWKFSTIALGWRQQTVVLRLVTFAECTESHYTGESAQGKVEDPAKGVKDSKFEFH